MFSGILTPAILALLTSSGVVVSADTHDTAIAAGTDERIATIGNRTAIGGWGPAAVVLHLFNGTSVNYTLRNMVADLASRLPDNPPPSSVAEAAKAYLTKVFAQLPAIGAWPDVNVLVAGIEPDGKPVTYSIRARLTAQKTPVPVELAKRQLVPGRPFPMGFGITRPEEELESSWPKIAPEKLAHERRSYSLTELADIAGLMLKVEAQTNKQVAIPVEQVFIEKDGKVKRRLWSQPE